MSKLRAYAHWLEHSMTTSHSSFATRPELLCLPMKESLKPAVKMLIQDGRSEKDVTTQLGTRETQGGLQVVAGNEMRPRGKEKG